ncbi:MAG: choice-of-anchor D domain-containing protein, partial [Candidatus Electrothrix sp. EH2]|nr:choice-of-anchor D domain-containing protein [Candidatus Electrothrix sp. EH2]
MFLPAILSGNSVKSDPDTPPKYFSLPGVGNTLNFGNVAIGNSVAQDLSIANTGGGGLKVDFIAFGGAHADDFRVESQKFPLIVQNGTPKSVAVICSPGETTGERQATLRLSCNDPAMPVMFEYPVTCTADPASPYCNLNTFFDIANNRSVGNPGKGYDSDRDRIKSQSCLNGEYSEIGAGSSEVRVDQISTYEELYQKVTTKKKNGGRFSLVNISFFADLFLGLDFGKKKASVFTSETRRKSLSESFVYQYELRVPNLEFQLNTSSGSLNGLGQGVIDDQCQFRSTCGDQFVYQVERGGSLYVALSFDFTSEVHKETFRKESEGNFGISLSRATDVFLDLIQDKAGVTARSYSSTKSYHVFDIVYHDNSTWVCIKDGTGKKPSQNPSYWKKKNPAQNYNASTTYSVGDFVNYQGELWGSVKDNNTGKTPGVDSEYWKKFEEPDENDKTDLASVEVNWSKFYDSLSEETKKATRLTIHAMQMGGNS